MKKISLTDKNLTTIRSKRKEKNMTQQDVAEMLGITFQKYQRIEAGTTKKIDYSILLKILDTLDLSQEDILNIEKPAKSYRFSPKLLSRVQKIQIENNLQSEREAIEYCLEDYFKNIDLANVRYEIEDIFTTSLDIKYNQLVDKLANTILADELIIKQLGVSNANVKEIKDKIMNILTARRNANMY